MSRRHETSSPGPRFRAQVRHYHRSGAKPESSWDEWTEGKTTSGKRRRPWGLILLLILGVALLVAILTGLVIEMGPG
jgi:hypothetical protein